MITLLRQPSNCSSESSSTNCSSKSSYLWSDHDTVKIRRSFPLLSSARQSATLISEIGSIGSSGIWSGSVPSPTLASFQYGRSLLTPMSVYAESVLASTATGFIMVGCWHTPSVPATIVSPLRICSGTSSVLSLELGY